MGRAFIRMLTAAPMAAAFALAACGGGGEPEVIADVHVHLDEWSVEPDVPSVSGPAAVTFAGHNHGQFPHQVVVIKTEMDAAALPEERGRVDVDAAGEEILAFEVPEADGGEGVQVGTSDLEPGNYVILCNIPGHYQQGMYAAFQVTSGP